MSHRFGEEKDAYTSGKFDTHQQMDAVRAQHADGNCADQTENETTVFECVWHS